MDKPIKVITTIGTEGLELIKQKEGFKASPYLCPAKVPTIGYGATYYPKDYSVVALRGKRVTLQDPPISEATASLLLKSMLKSYEQGVNSFTRDDINQNQFDALTSFAYNLGTGGLKGSNLLKKVNKNPNDSTIRAEFLKWVYANGKLLKGLLVRRKQEADLYFKK
jgi:lysozyme